MSWSVGAIGKVAAVANSIEGQFVKNGTCAQPEEGIRQAARTLIATALAGITDPATVVKVQAYGSQSQKYDAQGKGTGLFTNGLGLTVEPQYGFVE
jgi:hypothetical protein